MTITIMNLRNTKPTEPYDFYIDRRSPLGNKFPMKDESERDEVCEKYEEWFNKMKNSSSIIKNAPRSKLVNEMLTALKKYGQVRLFCWCAPKRCHGDTIKKYLEDLWQTL